VTAISPARPAATVWRTASLAWILPASGLAVAAAGLLVMVGWYAHWEFVIRGGPGLAAMKINAALCFVMCGAGMALMSTGRRRPAVMLAGAAFAIVAVTMLEYALHRDLGIDQLLIHDYLTPAYAHPGAMSPLTANCFLFIGRSAWRW